MNHLLYNVKVVYVDDVSPTRGDDAAPTRDALLDERRVPNGRVRRT